MNKTLETIFNRTSLRRYNDIPLKDDELEMIFEAILKAPTAGNMMLYSVLCIKDERTKKMLSKTCDNQEFIAKAPVVMIFLADMNKMYNYFGYCNVKEHIEEKGLDYRTGGKASLFLSISDALIAAQNGVIAGESLGIGSCYIGDVMEHYEDHKKILDLPDSVFPIGMLTFGYYPKDYKRVYRKRYDKKYVIFDEKYKNLSEEEFKDMYEEKERAFVKDVHKVNNFGQLLYERKFGNEFFDEMNRSVNEIIKHWR